MRLSKTLCLRSRSPSWSGPKRTLTSDCTKSRNCKVNWGRCELQTESDKWTRLTEFTREAENQFVWHREILLILSTETEVKEEPMSTAEILANREYKYGWVTDI